MSLGLLHGSPWPRLVIYKTKRVLKDEGRKNRKEEKKQNARYILFYKY